jgi:hypothetical protein
MMPLFGKEIEVEKINHPKYQYTTHMNSGIKWIREDWINYVPDFMKEISSIFDDILEDL